MVLRTLKLFLLSCSLFATALANAASTPEAFKGFYVGADVGFLGASSATRFSDTSAYLPPAHADRFAQVTGGTVSPASIIGGLQGGYNWRIAQYLFGITADWSLMNLNNTRNIVAPTAADPHYNWYVTQKIQTNWMISVHPRIGFVAKEKLLMYLTGGLAFANVSNTNNFFDDYVGQGNPPTPSNAHLSAQVTTIQPGWLVGVGEEFLITPKLSVQFEYLYTNFSTLMSSGTLFILQNMPYGEFDYATHLQFSTMRLGINYYF